MAKTQIPKNYQPIIAQLFIHAINSSVTPKLKSLPAPRKAHIKKKIQINFNKQQKFIYRTFYNHLPYINIVKKYIEQQLTVDENSVILFVDRIQSLFLKYRKAADTNITMNDFQFIDRIAEELVPQDKLADTNFISIAKAAVLYIFEMCDIGKIPQDKIEKPKPISESTLFDNE